MDGESVYGRAFFVTLALHEAVRDRLRADPDAVVAAGLSGAQRMLPYVEDEERKLVTSWVELMVAGDLDAIEAVLIGDDPVAVAMRGASPFSELLSEDELRAVVQRARAIGA